MASNTGKHEEVVEQTDKKECERIRANRRKKKEDVQFDSEYEFERCIEEKILIANRTSPLLAHPNKRCHLSLA